MNAKLAVPGMSHGIALPPGFDGGAATQREIIDFLDGRSDGAALMLAIYGDLVDEPLPPRLAALVERWRATMK